MDILGGAQEKSGGANAQAPLDSALATSLNWSFECMYVCLLMHDTRHTPLLPQTIISRINPGAKIQ